jgi:hypothetical protein
MQLQSAYLQFLCKKHILIKYGLQRDSSGILLFEAHWNKDIKNGPTLSFYVGSCLKPSFLSKGFFYIV